MSKWDAQVNHQRAREFVACSDDSRDFANQLRAIANIIDPPKTSRECLCADEVHYPKCPKRKG